MFVGNDPDTCTCIYTCHKCVWIREVPLSTGWTSGLTVYIVCQGMVTVEVKL